MLPLPLTPEEVAEWANMPSVIAPISFLDAARNRRGYHVAEAMCDRTLDDDCLSAMLRCFKCAHIPKSRIDIRIRRPFRGGPKMAEVLRECDYITRDPRFAYEPQARCVHFPEF